MPDNNIQQLSVKELKKKMDAQENFTLLDVREESEYRLARIPGARLFPLSQAASRIRELDDFKDKPLVVHCHHGGRSMRLLEYLSTQGFRHLWNVEGGIEAWSLEVDPQVPRY